MQTAPLLSLESVTKYYGDLPVLRQVTLQLQAGERVALTGPSGSGKSTLLNCILGIEAIDAGSVGFVGVSMDALPSKAKDRLRRQKMGSIFQRFHLLPTLSAYENVELVGRLVGMAASDCRARAEALLATVGLSHRLQHRPCELSGGEQQRVAIARAVMHRPKLLLADEPTGSLDSENRQAVLDLLEALSDRYEIALIMVTHDAATTRICDRCLKMQDGAVRAG
jgi:ABC-type lipoprotein export system ATPase subunit